MVLQSTNCYILLLILSSNPIPKSLEDIWLLNLNAIFADFKLIIVFNNKLFHVKFMQLTVRIKNSIVICKHLIDHFTNSFVYDSRNNDHDEGDNTADNDSVGNGDWKFDAFARDDFRKFANEWINGEGNEKRGADDKETCGGFE